MRDTLPYRLNNSGNSRSYSRRPSLESAFPRTESVDRLKAALRRWAFSLSAMAHESAVGEVSVRRAGTAFVVRGHQYCRSHTGHGEVMIGVASHARGAYSIRVFATLGAHFCANAHARGISDALLYVMMCPSSKREDGARRC